MNLDAVSNYPNVAGCIADRIRQLYVACPFPMKTRALPVPLRRLRVVHGRKVVELKPSNWFLDKLRRTFKGISMNHMVSPNMYQ